jgi:hypothetical protein
MQNSSQRSSSRPLVFNTKADVHHFVMGNASQAYSLNLPEAARTAPALHAHSSLFDRYNRPNLLLRDCDPKDIIALHKNLVMSEQPLSRYFINHLGKSSKRWPKKLPRTHRGSLHQLERLRERRMLSPFWGLLPFPYHQPLGNTNKTRWFSTITAWPSSKKHRRRSFSSKYRRASQRQKRKLKDCNSCKMKKGSKWTNWQECSREWVNSSTKLIRPARWSTQSIVPSVSK